MTDNYTVKINRAEGSVEITGSDKDWIAAQIERLAVVYEQWQADDQGDSSGGTRGGDKTNGSSEATRERKPRTRKSGANRASRKPELEAKLTKEIKTKLQDYVTERTAQWDKGRPNQVAIIATFLLDELSWAALDEDDVYTVYVVMGWPPPGNPRATLDNARQRKNYFGPWANGKVELSHTGENFGRHGSKAS